MVSYEGLASSASSLSDLWVKVSLSSRAQRINAVWINVSSYWLGLAGMDVTCWYIDCSVRWALVLAEHWASHIWDGCVNTRWINYSLTGSHHWVPSNLRQVTAATEHDFILPKKSFEQFPQQVFVFIKNAFESCIWVWEDQMGWLCLESGCEV